MQAQQYSIANVCLLDTVSRVGHNFAAVLLFTRFTPQYDRMARFIMKKRTLQQYTRSRRRVQKDSGSISSIAYGVLSPAQSETRPSPKSGLNSRSSPPTGGTTNLVSLLRAEYTHTAATNSSQSISATTDATNQHNRPTRTSTSL